MQRYGYEETCVQRFAFKQTQRRINGSTMKRFYARWTFLLLEDRISRYSSPLCQRWLCLVIVSVLSFHRGVSCFFFFFVKYYSDLFAEIKAKYLAKSSFIVRSVLPWKLHEVNDVTCKNMILVAHSDSRKYLNTHHEQLIWMNIITSVLRQIFSELRSSIANTTVSRLGKYAHQ